MEQLDFRKSNQSTKINRFFSNQTVRKSMNKSQRTHDDKKICIQTIMLDQMKNSLGINIESHVQNIRMDLTTTHPLKVRKMITNIQKNLNSFMHKGNSFGSGIRLKMYADEKAQDNQFKNMGKIQIFNQKLLEKEAERTLSAKNCHHKRSSQGELSRRFIQSSRKTYRKKNHQNLLLTTAWDHSAAYQGKQKINKLQTKRTNFLFNKN